MPYALLKRGNGIAHRQSAIRTMDEQLTNQEAELSTTRREIGILLAATISIVGFALVGLVWQVLGWGGISGWGWLGAIVQAALLLAIALVAALLARDLLAKLNQRVAIEDITDDPVSSL